MNPRPSRPPASPHPLPNFDRVARLYRWAEYLLLGPLLKQTREQFLPLFGAVRHALVLGDGDGRFTARLLRQAPHARVLALDASAAMLRLLARRCRFAAARLHLRQTSVLDLPSPRDLRRMDLVVSHFVLDCLAQAEVDALATQLGKCLPPGSRWVLSDFATPPHQPWRTLGKVYLRVLYWAFWVLTGLRTQQLPRIQPCLRAAGFRRLARVERLRGLLYSELWQCEGLRATEHRVLPFRATSPAASSSTLM